MAKYTPTPWHITEYGTNKDGTPKHYGVVRGEVTIANLGTSTRQNAIEMDANARLIAAAPDMHEALWVFAHGYEKWNKGREGGEDDLHYAAKQIKELLAKIEGGE